MIHGAGKIDCLEKNKIRFSPYTTCQNKLLIIIKSNNYNNKIHIFYVGASIRKNDPFIDSKVYLMAIFLLQYQMGTQEMRITRSKSESI